MKIARWLHNGTVNEGIIREDSAIAFPDGLTVADVLAQGLPAALALDHAVLPRERGIPLGEIRLLAPVEPSSIRDFVAFEEHIEGMTAGPDGQGHVPPEWYDAPTFYFTNPHTVLGPDQDIHPPSTQSLDFELEVAAVIGGTGGTNLDAQEGEAAIFGYTIMNDWSARDLQLREMQVRLGPAKGKDFATSLGPWIVTADELERYRDPDGHLALRGEASVNGVRVGEDLMSNMGWPFGVLVAYASRDSRVVPGDVLGSGTFGNGGCLGELWGRSGEQIPRPLAEGDEVRLAVEGIGELAGRVGKQAQETPWLPMATARSRTRRRAELRDDT